MPTANVMKLSSSTTKFDNRLKGQPSLWRITIEVSAEAEEAIADFLARASNQGISTYLNVETRVVQVTAYSTEKPEIPELKRKLAAGLKSVADCGLDVSPGRISICRLRAQDWRESWKRHFHPLSVGSRLLVKASWHRRWAVPGQRVVVLDPGLSFGTGQHPTTAFCLRELVRLRQPGQSQPMLDIGTGSGILAIAAAKLGYLPVEAVDFDPEAVSVAEANAARNRTLPRIRFRRQDVARLPVQGRKFQVVCANLISNLLIEHRERIAGRVIPSGNLVVAGILREEFPKVRLAFESAGLTFVRSRSEKEWCSGTFLRVP
jgi:ribosomal protein L11 methyltransferase